MARTNAAAVRLVLASDYGGPVSNPTPDLTPYIDKASLTVDRVAICAARKKIPLSAAELEMIERWLAAHNYTKSDRVYASRSTLDASGAFVVDPLMPEPYKAGAIDSDPSGCLKAILLGQRASTQWLGKTIPEQLDFEQRN